MRPLCRLGGVAAAAALVAACSDLHLNPAARRIETPIADPSFRYDIMPVFRQTCGNSGACHAGPNPQSDLYLADDSLAYVFTVNHPSVHRALLRVKPFFADSSFLYLVLSDTASVRLNFLWRMPLTEDPLPYPMRETIKNWINMGAKNN